MIFRLSIIGALTGTVALADPLFEDITSALPDHQYTGGWEHFVGVASRPLIVLRTGCPIWLQQAERHR